MTQIEKKESNQLAEMSWNDERTVLTLKFFDGVEEKFDTRLTSTGVHMDAKVYGFGVRVQRLGAVSATDFPSRKARAEEYRRRVREFRDWCYTGADSWDVPRKASGAKMTEADMAEVIERWQPEFAGKGQVVLTGLVADAGGDLDAVRTMLLGTSETAVLWVRLQAERREASVKSAGLSGDGLLAKMKAAAAQRG